MLALYRLSIHVNVVIFICLGGYGFEPKDIGILMIIIAVLLLMLQFLLISKVRTHRISDLCISILFCRVSYALAATAAKNPNN